MVLPRQRNWLEVFAIITAALMPLPETSPSQKAMTPSGKVKKS
jgi:hypothetical protein